MVIVYWLSHTGQGPHRGRLLRRKSSAEDSQRDTDKAKNRIRIREEELNDSCHFFFPYADADSAVNTPLSLGIAGKIRSMKTMGQGSGYLVKPAPVFDLGILNGKKILPEKLERVEQKSFQSQVWLSFLSHLLMETRSFCPKCLESL